MLVGVTGALEELNLVDALCHTHLEESQDRAKALLVDPVVFVCVDTDHFGTVGSLCDARIIPERFHDTAVRLGLDCVSGTKEELDQRTESNVVAGDGYDQLLAENH